MIAFIVVYAASLVRTAWLHDDAYITFRTIENFIHGDGLRYNVVERVQAFTHPLWLIVLTPFVLITGEFYFTSLFVCMLASLGTVCILAFAVARSETQALLGIGILLCSRAFMDYSTSGFENPLTHLLLAAFLALYLDRERDARAFLHLSLIAGFATINRMDSVLIFAPALALELYRLRSRKALRALLLGFLPLILWTGFALFYYGSPVPNTAFAKLGHDVPLGQLLQLGITYLVHPLLADQITLLVIVAALFLVFVRRSERTTAVAIGMLLYLAYVVKIGGSYSAGRFLTPVLLCAAFVIARHDFSAPVLPARSLAVALLLLVLLMPSAGLLEFPLRTPDPSASLILDVRKLYYPTSGLLNWRRGQVWPNHSMMHDGLKLKRIGTPVAVTGGIGFTGYAAGPAVHIIDRYGLSDPLLSRISVLNVGEWMPDHFSRGVPEGYVETIRTGENRIRHPQLAEFYDSIELVTRGPLFSARRLREVLYLNLGVHDHLLEAYEETLPSHEPYFADHPPY